MALLSAISVGKNMTLLLAVITAVAVSVLSEQAVQSLDDLYWLSDKGALQRAIKEYEAILARDPSSFEALKAVGIACHNMSVQRVGGMSPCALDYLMRASLQRPSDPQVLA